MTEKDKKQELGLQLKVDRMLIARETPSQRVLEIAVEAPKVKETGKRLPLNLSLVIDRSGSMEGKKLEYAKQAALHVVDLLQDRDRASVVIYDTEVEILVRSMIMDSGGKAEARACISRLRAGSSTNLAGGWFTGCHEIAENQREGMQNRALLLSDGLANVGITDVEMLSRHSHEIASRGISTSTFGVGLDYNEHLMEALANNGDGNYHFIESPQGIPEIFESEFKELAAITARDVVVKLAFPKDVELQVMGSWRYEKSEGEMTIFLGSLFSGKQQEILVKVLTPPAAEHKHVKFTAEIAGKSESGYALISEAKAAFKYAAKAEVDAEKANEEVLTKYAKVEVSDSATEALKLERKGEREKASRLLNEALRQNAQYLSAPNTARYVRMSNDMAKGMDEMNRKVSHQRVYDMKRSLKDFLIQEEPPKTDEQQKPDDHQCK